MANVNKQLGRHRSPQHKLDKCLKLANYVNVSALPVVPDNLNWISGNESTSWGMMLNDSLGSCTCSAIGHLIQVDTLLSTGTMVTVPDSAILSAYEIVGNYDPSDPSTDNGANMVDVLNFCKNTGIGGHKIVGYATFDPTNAGLLQAALWLFGSLYLGFTLPVSAQNQTDAGMWSVAKNDGGVWGGHAINLTSYSNFPTNQTNPDSSARLGKLITWGKAISVTENFLNKYCDEAHVILTQDWVNKNSNANIAGFNYNALVSDLPLIGS